MLSMMAPSSPHLPTYTFDFSTPFRPANPSPLSSSPIRASQSSPPLSPRNPNTLPRRIFHSSPVKSCASAPKFKFTARDIKKNPLKQTRENAQESRRKLFLKNVRQRSDDKAWDRRGGDQEVLKLEWATFDRRRRQQMDTDIDGLLFAEELDDITEMPEQKASPSDTLDDMMVDSHAFDEEAELEAMLSAYEARTRSSQSPPRPETHSLSDDEDYDALFSDLLSQEPSSPDIVLSGQMDLS